MISMLDSAEQLVAMQASEEHMWPHAEEVCRQPAEQLAKC